MEIKDNMVLNDQSKQEKKSFEISMQDRSKDVIQNSQSSSLNKDADQMVKKENVNNMKILMAGDNEDDIEMDEQIEMEYDSESDSNSNKKKQQSSKSNKQVSSKYKNNDSEEDKEEDSDS